MILAWQFIARQTSKKGRPSQRDGMRWSVGGIHLDLEQRQTRYIDALPYGLQIPSHRTYGTSSLLNRSLAINCQATIIQSLRDILGLAPPITNHSVVAPVSPAKCPRRL